MQTTKSDATGISVDNEVTAVVGDFVQLGEEPLMSDGVCFVPRLRGTACGWHSRTAKLHTSPTQLLSQTDVSSPREKGFCTFATNDKRLWQHTCMEQQVLLVLPWFR